MTKKNYEFIVNNKKVDVEVTRTKNKNMYMKIRDNKIIVLAPRFTFEKTIQTFIEENIEKFARHLWLLEVNKKYSFEDKYIYLLGKKYYFEYFGGFKKNSFEIYDDQIMLNLKEANKEAVTKYLKNILKDIVLEKITDIQRFWEKQMNIPFHEIKVIYKTGSWGTNYIGKQKISYSAKLAHYDKKILDYLVIHELAHYKEPNHSKRFWDIVKLYMPNYKEIQKILKLDPTLVEK